MSNEIKVVLSDVNKIITKVNWLSSNDYTSAEKTKVANVPNDTNAELATKASKLFATNLVTNGDFSNGTTGWTALNSTISASGNVLTITGNGLGTTPRSGSSIGTFASGKNVYFILNARSRNANAQNLYFSVKKTSVSGATLSEIIVSSPVVDQWYPVSFVAKTNDSSTLYTTSIALYGSVALANGSSHEIKYVSSVDLTTLFGAGNEPTKEQMDWIFTERDRLGLGYLKGTQELLPMVSLLNLINKKANIAQEAWITATLSSGTTGALRYAKNQLGIVTVIFEITIGTGTAFTQLAAFPTSYRPIVATSFNNVSVQAFNETNNTVVNIGLNSAGSFYNAQTLTTGHKIRGTFMFYAG